MRTALERRQLLGVRHSQSGLPDPRKRPEVRLGRALRPLEAEPPGGLGREASLELHKGTSRALQPTSRPGLSVDRMHALHNRRAERRRRASRPLGRNRPDRVRNPWVAPETGLALTLSHRQASDFELLGKRRLRAADGLPRLRRPGVRVRGHAPHQRRDLADPDHARDRPRVLGRRRGRAHRRQRQGARPDHGRGDLREGRRARGRAGLPDHRQRASRRRRDPRGGRALHRRPDRGRRAARSRGGVHAPLPDDRRSRRRRSPSAAGSGSSPSRPGTRSTARTST